MWPIHCISAGILRYESSRDPGRVPFARRSMTSRVRFALDDRPSVHISSGVWP